MINRCGLLLKGSLTTATLMIVMLTLVSCGENKKSTAQYQWSIPQGFPKPQVPSNNEMSTEKVALGKRLFYDKNLSFNRQQSCESCHQQAFAFAEPKVTSVGTSGETHRRNAPALVNIAYNKTLTWAHDGLTSLEQQILIPMFGESPIELGITHHDSEVLARFNTAEYKPLFSAAFPGQTISFDLMVKALASFVRSLISLNAPFDQYAYQGDDSAISTSALRGMNLFFSEKLECHHCHGGFNFTQSTSHEKQLIDRRPFHNTGLYNVKIGNNVIGYPEIDVGLAEISTLARDNGRFRAPTLRNVEVTAPYMHDGSISTLSQVLDFYARGGRKVSEGSYQGDGRENSLKSPFIKGFEMSAQDKTDLINFLKTLTDQSFLENAEFAKPVVRSQ
ncbi:methanobactin export MATE transporter MbnM [Thalassotalea castellviae]|uniref:Di-heme enzyme n=1 Tax=Thalassotalea castellviae TaxID=3075612 RepID=A0ABU2ZZR8_9GAMM|nr:methanobactin export MATE transporter MbnM [Thalassotalea sp. W431]MDT0603430.1 di-heme enzyme [Thalassotalea sp. W431]